MFPIYDCLPILTRTHITTTWYFKLKNHQANLMFDPILQNGLLKFFILRDDANSVPTIQARNSKVISSNWIQSVTHVRLTYIYTVSRIYSWFSFFYCYHFFSCVPIHLSLPFTRMSKINPSVMPIYSYNVPASNDFLLPLGPLLRVFM